ncbi:MAG: PIN domain-containing protein [Anaerolineae bacterium]|nr:PIN domain-containing protein [Anaerolineae bacterium]
MTVYVVDTNIISLALRDRASAVFIKLDRVMKSGDRMLGCPVVWYEIRRGLLAKDAHKQMEQFEKMFATFEWQDLTQADWTLATSLWAQRRTQGRPISVADRLIAAFTINRSAVLATHNEKDFDGLNVTVENWTKDT